MKALNLIIFFLYFGLSLVRECLDGLYAVLCQIGNLPGQITNLLCKSLLVVLKSNVGKVRLRQPNYCCEQQATKNPINWCHNVMALVLHSEKSGGPASSRREPRQRNGQRQRRLAPATC